MQRDFGVKIRVWGKWVCKGLLGKIGVLGEMSMQRKTFRLKMGFGGKWACKKTFGLKIGFC